MILLSVLHSFEFQNLYVYGQEVNFINLDGIANVELIAHKPEINSEFWSTTMKCNTE